MNIQQELIDAPGPQQVLVVEVEPDYWHRGHYCEGSKPYINPLEVWKLPVGTKLYTVPPAPSVPNGWKHDCAGILQNDVELWLDSCPHCGKPKTDAAPTPAEAPEPEPVAWMVKNGFVCSMIYRSKKDADNYAADQQKRHDLSGSLASFCVIPLYTDPARTDRRCSAGCCAVSVASQSSVVSASGRSF